MSIAIVESRAGRLLQFLRAMQEMRTRPVRDVGDYPRIFWLAAVPAEDPRCGVAWTSDIEQREGIWLSVDRVDRIPPPEPPVELEPWIEPNDLSDSSLDQPSLLSATDLPVEVIEPSGDRWTDHMQTALNDHPEVRTTFANWLPAWQGWATRDRADAQVWHTYNSIYALYQEQRGQVETLEIILGLGLLSTTSGGVRVRRHLVAVGAVVDLDLDTGRLVVKPDPDNPAPSLEEDMLDPQDRVPSATANTVRAELDVLPAVFGADGTTQPIRAWTNAFQPDAVFAENFDRDSSRAATVVLAPALIIRRRGRESFLQAIDTVTAQLEAGSDVPATMAQVLLDPEDSNSSWEASDDTFGATHVTGDDEVYFPQPANDEQREIAGRLERNRVVVVQGPPGTGKTHTIANLVTNWLAHGKRVLITSHGSRALKVLKDKLPDEVRDLCVSLADISVRGQQDLQRSVGTIIDRVTRQSVTELDKEHERLERAHTQARTERVKALDGLREIREQERQPVPAYRGAYSGSPQEIAEQVAADEQQHGWLGKVDPDAERVTGVQINRLSWLMRAATDETRHLALPLPREAAPSPEDFARVAARRAELQHRLDRPREGTDDEFPRFDHLDPHITGQLQRLCDGIGVDLRQIASGHAWTDAALHDLWTGREQHLVQTRAETTHTRDALRRDLEIVGSHHVTGLAQIDVAAESGHLHALSDHLAAGRPLRRLGRPTKPARDAEAALAAIRIDGRICTTADDVGAAAAACAVELRLREWEVGWHIQPGADSQGLRAAQLDSTVALLDRVLALKPSFEAARALAARVRGLSDGHWYDISWVERLADYLASDDVERKLAETGAWASSWATELRTIAAGSADPGLANAAAEAMEQWDVDTYTAAWPDLERRWDATRVVQELSALERQLRTAAPDLVDAVTANPQADLWGERGASVDDAYSWAEWDLWLRGIVDPADETKLRNELDGTDVVIKRLLLEIATNRAWRFCQSRMTSSEQQNLKIYATSTKKIGKGTGKYAHQHRRDARQALAKAQSAVPAWIMPLRSVVDTVPFDNPGIFDVVIVDEASQSGHEALLLLWLGKRILVVGDDEQISPESIGLDHEAIFHQQTDLLYDFPTRPIFGPTNSFLDHAEALAPNPVTLLEHFRCMPEIIGFSNNLSYHGRLLPVRQFGLDRLEPLHRTYIKNGRVTGNGQRACNKPEAMQIVETIEKCCSDPAYDGKSMGVITFLGSAQARLISDLLLERVGPLEMESRALRVDKPEAFQGDERDVIFLSLVASQEGDDGQRRIGTMARRADQQRLNVAASRARDQLWLFHSVRPEDLPGGDFRRQYLEYLAEPVGSQIDPMLGDVLPDVPHQAFDSIFEQRVYLAIVGRGYRVRPQYPAGRYRVDLVVQGGAGHLAVECDGDAYHDADRETDDILRQRELERLGWRFWRVRGSQFFRDPIGSLSGLWEMLDGLGIEPEAPTAQVSVHEEVEAPEPAVPTKVAVATDFATNSGDEQILTVVPRVNIPAGAIVMGPASLARVQREADLLEEDLRRGHQTAAAGDARVRTAVAREWQKREGRLSARLDHVRSVLDRAFVAPATQLDGSAWPGAVIQYRDEGSGDVYDAVVSETDLADEAYDHISPTSPFGKLLENVQAGQRLSFSRPNGESAVIEIVSISD